MMATVSLCMIVRNEERNLSACLGGVRPLVDELIVVDTGSTDATRSVAAGWGARVFDFPWCDDFSAARNESRRHATGDWVFWLDADDRIDAENTRRLAALFGRLEAGADATCNGYMMACHSLLPATRGLGCEVSHLRLFPRALPIAWTGRVHERLEPTDGRRALRLQWSDVSIRHEGYQEPLARRRKVERNLRLLQLDFAAQPDDAITLFHLGWSYLELRNLPEALRFLKRSLRSAGPVDSPHERKTHALVVECLTQMQRPQEALGACRQALRQFPQDTELLYQEGCLLGTVGDLAAAEASYLRLLTTPADAAFQYGVESGLRGPKTRYMLGLLYEQQGRTAEAEFQYRAALADQPDYAFAWVGLGQLCLSLGRAVEFASVIEQLAACPGGEPLACTLLARQRILEQRFEEARQLLDRALAFDPEFTWPQLVLSDLLFASGRDWPLCVQVHRDLLRAFPQHAGLRERLDWLLAHAPARAMSGAPAGADEGDALLDQQLAAGGR